MRITIGSILIFVLLAATGLVGQTQPTQADKSMPQYDRIQSVREFLQTIYPELSNQDGLLTIIIGLSDDGTMRLSFRPCRTGSGVPGSSEQPSSRVPDCFPAYGPEEEAFLSADIFGFTRDRSRPIGSIYLRGNYIDPQLRALKKQFRGRVYSDQATKKPHFWTESSALRDLQSEHPKFGPSNKAEFLAAIPTDAVQKVAGCKLLTDTAQFQVFVWPTQPPRLEWVVNGDAAATETSPKASCTASFEPFYGRMTSFAINPAPIEEPPEAAK